ncbi:hypothetical protein CO054_01490 [Candidatus Shapirobacteria bacterium CG_4_9_14_0_2_um_filter_39_11]|uniref:GIY-YIG domain-containing protein n=1 Tax=Candidatus Shapirobacteria bacterium CG_4_9_14_0_2_um_filter_39_11 TaxID=1974478 RepID=A0A2M8ESS4_9BACT|nr:MAG: hypothetical protein CO054_01490 [Candidatus Shapirobacteria bacterium CG_4_9_14_0_2_um_filter_39_11]
MDYFVYIARCRDGSLYTGSTWNIAKRIQEHNFNRRGAKSLKGKLPVKLIYSETFETRVEALKREKEIKGWRKEKKEKLIALALMSVAKKRV